MPTARQVAVVGGGWAGLAAAVEATRRGHHVTLYEMAPQLGGRARTVDFGDAQLDNGQHILIGAYSETLAMMRAVGVDPAQAFVRTPLAVPYPDGSGLQLAAGPTLLTFAMAIMRYRGWRWRDKQALMLASTRWALQRFRCDASLSVAELTAPLPRKVIDELIDPLCVAALNTPASQASASVFLRVLKDALFSGAGSSDLLLPRVRMSELWPAPAWRWLESRGATIKLATRVTQITRIGDQEHTGAQWSVDGQPFDSVVLGCSAHEASRLTANIAPTWSEQAGNLRYEPIVTVYARCTQSRALRHPMMALRSDAQRPAQFAFDLSQLGGPDPVIALVVSGAKEWVSKGMAAVESAALAQASAELQLELQPLQTTTEKRATFLCTPGLVRPQAQILPQLLAAGDYVHGPYPATLEGAIRSGITAGHKA